MMRSGWSAVKNRGGLLCIFRSSARSGNAGRDVGVENHAGVFHPFDLTVRLLEVVVLLGKGKHIVEPAFDAKIEPTHPLVVQQPQFLVRLLPMLVTVASILTIRQPGK